jgi:hypothetical protein
MTMIPLKTQIKIAPPTLPVPARTFGGTVKIPEPMVLLRTIQTSVNGPSNCFVVGATSILCQISAASEAQHCDGIYLFVLIVFHCSLLKLFSSEAVKNSVFSFLEVVNI